MTHNQEKIYSIFVWWFTVAFVVCVSACGEAEIGDSSQAGTVEEETAPLLQQRTIVDVIRTVIRGPGVKNPGSDNRTGVGPSLYNQGLDYLLTLPFNNPTAGPITQVSYNWSLSYRPVGLGVFLCRNNTGDCVDVTNFQSGIIHDFDGLTSNVPFIFRFFVEGSGIVNPPAIGLTDQVIISHS